MDLLTYLFQYWAVLISVTSKNGISYHVIYLPLQSLARVCSCQR